MPALTGPIKNIVVLMMENRSFDHMLGYFAPTQDSIGVRLFCIHQFLSTCITTGIYFLAFLTNFRERRRARAVGALDGSGGIVAGTWASA